MTSVFIYMALLISQEPQKPVERPWPGGAWTGEDPDRGKYFAPGAFTYIPRAEHDAYEEARLLWEKIHPGQSLKLSADPIRFDFYDLARVLPTLQTTMEGGTPVAKGPLKAYGGEGQVSVTRSSSDVREITISMKGCDLEKMSDGIGLRTPIRIYGTVDRVEGTIVGDKGHFIGTGVHSNGNIMSRMELTVDLKTGAYTSQADTVYGHQVRTGKLRPAKQ